MFNIFIDSKSLTDPSFLVCQQGQSASAEWNRDVTTPPLFPFVKSGDPYSLSLRSVTASTAWYGGGGEDTGQTKANLLKDS